MADEQQKIVAIDPSTLSTAPGSTPIEFDGELEAEIVDANIMVNTTAPEETDKKGTPYRHAFLQVKFDINGKDKHGNDLKGRIIHGNYGAKLYQRPTPYLFAGKQGATGRLLEIVNTVFGKQDIKDLPATLKGKKVFVRNATTNFAGKEYKKVEITRFRLS